MVLKYIVLVLLLTSILPVILAIPEGVQVQEPYLAVDPPAPKHRKLGSWSGKRNFLAYKRNMPDIIIDFDKLKSGKANQRLLAKLQEK